MRTKTLTERSGEQAKTLASQIPQDTLDRINKNIERSNERLALYNRGFIESYVRGKLHVVLGIGAESSKYNLLLRAIPSMQRDVDDLSFRNPEFSKDRPKSHRNEPCSVLDGITEIVERPEKVIPSTVRLECFNEVPNVHRNILGPSFHVSAKVNGAAAEGKRCVLGSYHSDSNGDRVSGSVKGIAEVMNGIGCDVGNGNWQDLRGFELASLLAGNIRIMLFKNQVRVGIYKGGNLPFQVRYVFLCACDLTP